MRAQPRTARGRQWRPRSVIALLRGVAWRLLLLLAAWRHLPPRCDLVVRTLCSEAPATSRACSDSTPHGTRRRHTGVLATGQLRSWMMDASVSWRWMRTRETHALGTPAVPSPMPMETVRTACVCVMCPPRLSTSSRAVAEGSDAQVDTLSRSPSGWTVDGHEAMNTDTGD